MIYNAKLIQMIRGSKAKRYQDGILSISTRHAKTIAHTGTAIMASEAKQQFIRDNPDLVTGIKVSATLDLRTSPICRHLDGEFMPIERAKYPPYHFNCRSSFEIVYDGYTPPTQRASMDGVVKNQTYYEWLNTQDKAYIQSVLGKQKAELFLADGMTADKFKRLGLDRSFMPMGLDELLGVERVQKSANFKDIQASAREIARLTNQGVRPSEAELADKWQQYFGVQLVGFDKNKHKITGDNPPDLAEVSDLPTKQWRTLDVIYTLEAGADIERFLHSFNKSEKAWEKSKVNIIKHIEKADVVPMYMKHFDSETSMKIILFVLSLPKEQQEKIVFIWDE